MSQKYFDESGDVGDLLRGSNTDHFSVAVYDEQSIDETKILENKIREILGLKNNAVLKWQKLSKVQRTKFESVFENILMDKVYVIYWNKKECENKEGLFFEKMMSELILKFRLFGNYKYEGSHLIKILEKIRKDLKFKGVKVYFKNSDTRENFGIQICDLVAGFIRSRRDVGQSVNYKNVIKFRV